ncbi:MAG: DUF2147 domain-containing protein [Rhodospirillales bacterium]|nr:DUF2147 domain-containing protein [Rhodospirillales bacterium]
MAAITVLVDPRTEASATVPQGVWLMERRVAVQIFDCAGLLCGRILWLRFPRDPEGPLVRDKDNPDPALRQRPLCGLAIIWTCTPAVRNAGEALVLQSGRWENLPCLGAVQVRRRFHCAH